MKVWKIRVNGHLVLAWKKGSKYVAVDTKTLCMGSSADVHQAADFARAGVAKPVKLGVGIMDVTISPGPDGVPGTPDDEVKITPKPKIVDKRKDPTKPGKKGSGRKGGRR